MTWLVCLRGRVGDVGDHVWRSSGGMTDYMAELINFASRAFFGFLVSFIVVAGCRLHTDLFLEISQQINPRDPIQVKRLRCWSAMTSLWVELIC